MERGLVEHQPPQVQSSLAWDVAGMFNIGGKSSKFKPPPPKMSDIDFEIKVGTARRDQDEIV